MYFGVVFEGKHLCDSYGIRVQKRAMIMINTFLS